MSPLATVSAIGANIFAPYVLSTLSLSSALVVLSTLYSPHALISIVGCTALGFPLVDMTVSLALCKRNCLRNPRYHRI